MSDQYFVTVQNGRNKALTTAKDLDNLPTADQKAAFPTGCSGSDQLIKNTDSRLSDARTPVSHDNTYHSATYITSSGVTYENLNTNGDVGTTSSTVAAGDDGRFPTTDEKAALAGEGTPSGSNKFTTKSYVDNKTDGLEWYASVNYGINYVKATAGAPSGTPSTGERCLNTNEAKLYTEATGAWDAGVSVNTGERFVFMVSGTDTTGNSGTYTKTNKIYQYTGSAFTETTPVKGATFNLDENALDYRYDGTSLWIEKASTTSHNNLSGKQGGTTDEYYHLTVDQRGSINSATSPSSSNPAQMLADRSKVPARVVFTYLGGFAANQTDVEPYESGAVTQRIVMPVAGSIVKASVKSSAARTAGTLTVEPTIDGTKSANNDLDLQLNGTDTTKDYAAVAPAQTNLTFGAGGEVGFKMTSSADWANAAGDLQIEMFVVFNS